jgi:superfamily II DNA or RNA helicase
LLRASFISYWDYREYQDFLSFSLKPDRASIMSGQRIFWEIDRSTMIRAKIIQKIEKYLKYARHFNREFVLVFACSDRRAKSLVREFSGFINKNVLLYTVDYKQLLNNPTGEIFNSATGKQVALLQSPVSR